LKDKEHSGQSKKFEDAELQVLLDENSTRTLKELAEASNKSVFNCLHIMGQIQKESKWIPHKFELAIKNRLIICTSFSSQKEAVFVSNYI